LVDPAFPHARRSAALGDELDAGRDGSARAALAVEITVSAPNFQAMSRVRVLLREMRDARRI